MWFKNLRIYRLTAPFDSSAKALEEALASRPFTPVGKTDLSRQGFVPPLGKQSTLLAHVVGQYTMICVRKQEKILPAAAVNELVEEKVEEFEAREARSIFRKERQTLKDDVIHALLPRALTRSSHTYAYFDSKKKLLIVDVASVNKADEFLDVLRATIGTLPVVPLSCHGDAAQVMTRWVKQRSPDGFELDNECEMKNSREVNNVVRCRNQELDSEEVMTHIKNGKRVTQLAICWREAIRFVFADDFAIKRVRFEDNIQEQAQADPDDAAAQFDQDFAVMSHQVRQFVDEIIEQFGGLEKLA